ncbi:hypothetical protein [Anaerotignum faecicola]
MKRTAMERLVVWKSSDERKLMVLKGTRQDENNSVTLRLRSGHFCRS